MSTSKLIWEPGASYHVTTRGNRREEIFRDEEDYNVYLRLLKNNLIYYSHLNYELIVYCLMINHIHLLIKTDKEPLTRFMARINSMYTKYFNKKYGYIGHLFQDTYFSEIIKNDRQMIETSRYIHMNPVKANMVELPEEYHWSSYSMVIGQRNEQIINSETILNYFKYQDRFQSYKEYVTREA